MKTQEVTTTDLAAFGSTERALLVELLTAWKEQGLPKEFYDDQVVPMMNRNSGYVFLTNSEFQACMMNGDKLQIWNSCPNCGNEGFSGDCDINDDGECNECSS